MDLPSSPRMRGSDLIRFILGLLTGLLLLADGAFALSISPSSVQVAMGASTAVAVTNTDGTVTATSSNDKVASVAYRKGVATIQGKSAGSATVTVKDKESKKKVSVTVTATSLTVSPTSVTVAVGSTAPVSVSNPSGTVNVSSASKAIATVSYASGVATIRGVAAGTTSITIADKKVSKKVTVTVTAASLSLTVSPASVSVVAGSTGSVNVSNASGTVTGTSSNTAIATVTYASGVATIRGLAAGTATITIADQKTSKQVTTTVTAASSSLTVSPTSVTVATGSTAAVSVTNASGTVTATSSKTSVATVTYASGVATIRGVAAGTATITIADSKTSKQVSVTVATAPAPTTGSYSLLAWNTLGMHCVDGADYSMFSILPPFNVLNAQLVNKSTGQAVTSGVTLTYEAVADTRGSINTISSTKTNFWQYVQSLFPGFSPAQDVGLAGFPTPSTTPAAMSFNATNSWFEAVGIPITSMDDTHNTNYYPMVLVTAKSGNGQILATTKVTLPVSDEMSCVACHASTNGTNAAANAAKPKAGWAFDSNTVTDWKKNILRLHDQMQAGNTKYTDALAAKGLTGGLYASAINGKPALCATCHSSNAFLIDAGLQTGVSGIPPLTQAIHSRHANVTDPTTGLALDNTTNRGSCYQCHPGSVTQCLRGAMSDAKDANGNVGTQCQSCHGKMSQVAEASRQGWMSEPGCQTCHHDGKRELSAVDANGKPLARTDTRFATNANKPSAGYSLYRFSVGHGGMQCEACHGPTHAEYPTTEPNDNVQSIALQGHAGTISECTACHATVPNTTTGGPHGMHTVGSAWISSHKSAAKSGTTACAYCHGSDFRGTGLSEVKMAKSFKVESKTVSFIANQKVGCYDCHNGPSGD
jgi:hypothetical protein